MLQHGKIGMSHKCGPSCYRKQGRRKECPWCNRPKKPGITVNKQFYALTNHFLKNRNMGDHIAATDSRIRSILRKPDFVEPPQGGRQVFWRRFRDLGRWVKVVVQLDVTEPVVITAHTQMTEDSKNGSSTTNRVPRIC